MSRGVRRGERADADRLEADPQRIEAESWREPERRPRHLPDVAIDIIPEYVAAQGKSARSSDVFYGG
jgi:hypothetical protein